MRTVGWSNSESGVNDLFMATTLCYTYSGLCVYFYFQVVQVLVRTLIPPIKLMEVQMMRYGKNVSSYNKINWYSTSSINIFNSALHQSIRLTN